MHFDLTTTLSEVARLFQSSTFLAVAKWISGFDLGHPECSALADEGGQ
jgi:hypothetical protein